ncbi:flagellar protein FliT [Trinickia violacea]|uniref:Flagellar protein FliT n=1 Tax=Trinickia violacea TaxID=2571746 RepID=A0A4P8ILV1_9BURK|nr:flagellar protein FliT [Trinickia violacea]QCP47754.1 flagellar protein FliT [Trinickia violacea]
MTQESLSRAYELTKTIASAVEAGDWLFASDLADERSPLLMTLGPTQTPEALATIRAIQEIDATITRKTHDEREAMMSRQSEAMKRIAATSLYNTTGKL